MVRSKGRSRVRSIPSPLHSVLSVSHRPINSPDNQERKKQDEREATLATNVFSLVGSEVELSFSDSRHSVHHVVSPIAREKGSSAQV